MLVKTIFALIALSLSSQIVLAEESRLPPCLSQDRKNWNKCYGYFSNRAGSFEGEFHNGVVNGFGTFKNKNGNIYSGYWKNAHFDGVGTLTYADGRRYTGHWVRDKRNGFGAEVLANGIKAEGQWSDDRFVGEKGIPTRSDSSPKFQETYNEHDSSRRLAPNEVRLIDDNGTYKVPVLINGAIKLDFTVDSGASDVSIPADVVLVMIRSGSLTKDDFLGNQTFRLADGTLVPSQTFRIKTLTVGGRTIEDVVGSMAGVNGSLLLGQSFLKRFKSVSFDYQKNVLVLQ